MNSLICQICKDKNRICRVVYHHYVDLRSGSRQSCFSCSSCDLADSWPVFTRTSPPVPKEP